MPFGKFDRTKLHIKLLDERVSDLDLSVMLDPDGELALIQDGTLDCVAEAVLSARRQEAEVLLMYGAHVIRSGCGPYMIRLLQRGLVTHYATNGAGAIHDFEFALKGKTCESVARYISEGQFGLWHESGLVNNALKEGLKHGLGAGEAIGRYIWENGFPHRETSVLAAAYRLQKPATVHIGIGSDIIHEHPNADGAVLGAASYDDFLIYADTVTRIENGVFLNFGSAVTGPEVYLKALAMARNVAHSEGRTIYNITTAVFDLLELADGDYSVTPPKSDPRYYFRPWKTILARTVADGGRSYYIRGSHRDTLPALAHRLFAGSAG